MTVRVANNGFGRIGRSVLRAIAEYNRTDVTPRSRSLVVQQRVGLLLPHVRYSRRVGQAPVNHG